MNAPTLRIVIGTAGSGKSTIAQRLARQHGAAYLDKDAMSARFVEAALVSAGYDPGDREANPFYRDCVDVGVEESAKQILSREQTTN